MQKFERLRTMRRKRGVGYAVAAASVAVASVVRANYPELLAGIPFAPYIIAVGLATLVGGGGPGVLTALLSAAAATYLASGAMIPATTEDVAAAGLFMAVAGMVLTLIWLLNHAIDRLWYQAENARLIVESQPAGVIGVDAEGRITLVNSAVERQLGYPRGELLDRPVDQLVPVEVRKRHTGLRASYMDRPEQKMMGLGRDLSAVAKDGSLLPVEVGLNPVSHGGRNGALATIVDISERKKLERRTEVLAKEVSHRASNLLAVVRALATRKLPRESSAEFISTLDSLARTQDVFGRKEAAPLSSILRGELAGFSAQTSISGCEILLTPSAGQDFSLMVHELATNAAKYGALSAPGGTITVEGGQGDDGRFRLVWSESGGPKIEAPPERVGFGLRLLREIATGLQADVTFDYLPHGLRVELAVPMERITNVSPLAGASMPA